MFENEFCYYIPASFYGFGQIHFEWLLANNSRKNGSDCSIMQEDDKNLLRVRIGQKRQHNKKKREG